MPFEMEAQPPGLSLSPREYQRRFNDIRRRMSERRIDLLLVDQEQHLAYLTGFSSRQNFYQACLIPLDGEPLMLVRGVDAPKFREMSWVKDHVIVSDWEDPVALLIKTINQKGWANKPIGIELASNYLTARRYEAIRASLPDATLVDFTDALCEQQLIKSDEELALVKQAASIADAATLSAFAAAGEGKTERDAVKAGFGTLMDLGADSDVVGFVAAGGRSQVMHARLGNHRFKKGDVLFTEFMPQVKGYSARLMRCAVIGPPSYEQEDLARRMIGIQDQQIEAMRPGAVAKDIDAIVREQVLDSGLRDKFDGNTGYTLGYLGPTAFGDFTRLFLPTSQWQLEAGMVFHMYLFAQSMAFSETVLVNDHGPERLTKLDRKLFVC